MSKHYKDVCIKILKENGPLLGSELRTLLMKKEAKITYDNARTIINRLKRNGDILSTDPVKLKHKELIYFLPFHSLKAKIKNLKPEHSTIIPRMYQAIVEEDGFLLWSEFIKISAGVVDHTQSKRKTAEAIFIDLKNIGIVRELFICQGIPVVVASKDWFTFKGDDPMPAIKKRIQKLAFTKGLTEDLLKWLESMNLIGWSCSHVKDIQNFNEGYNGFYFDATSYTYLWGMYRTNSKDELFDPAREKAGSPVLIESILHRPAKRHDISGFIERIQNVNGPMKTDPNLKILPICFVDRAENDAYTLARERGILIMKLTDVFGTKLAQSLKELQDIDPDKVDPQKLLSILEKANDSGRDGEFGNLKGYVFNFLVASIFNDAGYRTSIGMKYMDGQERNCECDIVYEDPDIIIACEVKGRDQDHETPLGKDNEENDSVRKFFERTCSIMKKATGKTIIPVFITSGKFSGDALRYLTNKNDSPKMQLKLKYNFPSQIYYDRKSLLNYFGNQRKFTEHKQVLKQYFNKEK